MLSFVGLNCHCFVIPTGCSPARPGGSIAFGANGVSRPQLGFQLLAGTVG